MFNVTCKIRKLLRAGVNVCLGTDSTHSGSINTLAEMKYARKTYRELYGEELPAKTLVDMVTVNAARGLGLSAKTGSLETGKLADIAVFRARSEEPYESLCAAEMEDLALLVIGGEPVYGEEGRFGELFSKELSAGQGKGYSRVTVGGRGMFVKGDPVKLYRGIRAAVGFEKKLDYLPFEI